MLDNTYKNHVYVVFDTSGSMYNIIDKSVEVFNTYIDILRIKSLKYEQETRISFYKFDSRVDCLISDVDVARPVKLDKVSASGPTSLFDAINLAIQDSKLVSQKYGDHSFIIYVITDGEENTSKTTFKDLKDSIKELPNNYTIAALVPNRQSIGDMKLLGLSEGNIIEWKTTLTGVEEVGRIMQDTTDNFMQGRKSGVRSSKTIFSDLSQVNKDNVTQVLKEENKRNYTIIANLDVQAVEIRPLVTDNVNINYTKGCAFYELVKNEHIQASKEIMIQNKKTGKVYSGSNARALLGLPNSEVKFKVGDFGEWIIFVQSTSVNRKIIPKQRVIVKL